MELIAIMCTVASVHALLRSAQSRFHFSMAAFLFVSRFSLAMSFPILRGRRWDELEFGKC